MKPCNVQFGVKIGGMIAPMLLNLRVLVENVLGENEEESVKKTCEMMTRHCPGQSTRRPDGTVSGTLAGEEGIKSRFRHKKSKVRVNIPEPVFGASFLYEDYGPSTI